MTRFRFTQDMFERPQSGENAILVHVDFPGESEPEDLLEFSDLAISAGAVPRATVTASRNAPDARFYVGSGKAEEIRDLVNAEEAELVIFNHELSPSQERNLEKLLQARVLDRTGLILDIFAQRARSFEGKLQVELAQLKHLSTRLIRGWTHLERQKGGIGLRGPGETQLETDRRRWVNASSRLTSGWKRCVDSVPRGVERGNAPKCRQCHWLAIPMPVNPPFLTACVMPKCMRLTNYSRPWTRP